MSRWWRAYDEAVDDPKLILLTDRQHRTWFNLCCISSQNDGILPGVPVIAVKLRMTPDKVRHAVAELIALRFVDNVDGKLTVHNWNGRQFKSDVSNERVKRHRERHGNGDGNVTPTVTVTPPETDTETETDNTPSLRSGVRATRSKPATRIPDDFQPDIGWAISSGLSPERAQLEAANFIDHWRQSDRPTARKRDWPAAWRVWCRRAFSEGGPRGQNGSTQRANGRVQSSRAGFLGRLADIASQGDGHTERQPDFDDRVQDQRKSVEGDPASTVDLEPGAYSSAG